LSDEEIGQSIRLINTYLGGQVIPGERIQILVEGETVDEKVLERVSELSWKTRIFTPIPPRWV